MRLFATLNNVAAAARRLPSRGRKESCTVAAPKQAEPPAIVDDADNSTETGTNPSKDASSSRSALSLQTVEELAERAAEERDFIRSHDKTVADVWYIVDARWVQEWRSFVSQAGEIPKSISNHRLVDSRNVPYSNLKPADDYRGVNKKVWEFWHQRYGGGPVIRRRTIDIYGEPVDVDSLSDHGFEDAISSEDSPTLSGSRRRRPYMPSTFSSAERAPAALSGESEGFDDDISSEDSRSYTGSRQAGRGRRPLQVSITAAARPAPKRSASSSHHHHRSSGSSSQATRGTGFTVDPARGSCEPVVVHKLCCDRCDGPHESEKCPHFREPRDKHQDAWVNHGKGKKDDGGHDGGIIIRHCDAKIIPQPPDGSCLFHSLRYGLRDRSTAAHLRKQISEFIARNPNMTIADTAISDWVHYDSGGSVQAYADRMATDLHQWGGGIEMAALTKMKHVNVHVYEKCREGYHRISAFNSAGADKTVNVLYQGRMHYDAMELL